MAEALTEDDIKFFLSVEPDEEAVRKAVEQINRDIEAQKVAKIRMGIEEKLGLTPPKPPEQKDPSWLSKYGPTAAIGAGAGLAGGAAYAAVGGLLASAKQLAAAPFKLVTAGFGLVSDVLHDIQGPLGPIGAGLNLFSKGLNTLADAVSGLPLVGGILGSVFGTLGKLPGILKGILEAGTSLASKVSPATVKQMSMAVEDFQATVGQMFVPVVELMTDVISDLSDIVANFLPNAEEMRGAMDSLRKAWGLANTSLKEVAMEIGPAVRETIVGAIKSLGETLAEWIPGLDATKGALGWIKDAFGRVKDAVVDAAKAVWEFGKGLVDKFKIVFNEIGQLVKDLRYVINPQGMVEDARQREEEAQRKLEEAQKRREEEVGKEYLRLLDAPGGINRTPKDLMDEAQENVKQRRAQERAAAAAKGRAAASVSVDDWGEKTPAAAEAQRQLSRTGITAARQAKMGGIEDYQRQLQLSAFSMGGFGTGPESVPRNVGNLAAMVGNIEKWFQKMTPQQFEALVRSGGTSPNATRDAVRMAENDAAAHAIEFNRRFGMGG